MYTARSAMRRADIADISGAGPGRGVAGGGIDEAAKTSIRSIQNKHGMRGSKSNKLRILTYNVGVRRPAQATTA